MPKKRKKVEPHECKVCGRKSMSRAGRRYKTCGPHLPWINKPADWWDDFDEWVRKTVGLDKEK